MKLEDLDKHLKPDKNGCLIWQRGRNGTGYGAVSVNGKKWLVHRLVIAQDADIPPGMKVDHICHNPLCARRDHLRVVTNKQNSENVVTSKNSSSGVRGVGFYKALNKWRAYAMHDGKNYHGGYFDSKEDAEQAAIALRNKLFTHNDLDKK